jgi:hypothetical protein
VLVDDLPSWTSFPKKPLLQQLRNRRLPTTSEVEKRVQKKAQTKKNKLVRLSKNQLRKEMEMMVKSRARKRPNPRGWFAIRKERPPINRKKKVRVSFAFF